MSKFGLIGKNIEYSFSKAYFMEKFKKEGLAHSYINFDIASIEKFPAILTQTPDLIGLNVTIPYKEAVIPYVDKLKKKAFMIGAVNTIKITEKGELIGYNTDYYGFKKSLEPLLQEHHRNALILGTGGASKAVVFALRSMGISCDLVSRNPGNLADFTYSDLTTEIIEDHEIIVNCTPLGTHPEIDKNPDIPYSGISSKHLLYDLVYNPAETTFLKKGKFHGAVVFNGQKMLELQAEKAWKIWQ